MAKRESGPRRVLSRRAAVLAVAAAACLRQFLPAQGNVLFINEVLPSNDTQEPADIGGAHPGMVEIFNASGAVIALGSSNVAASFFLSATTTFHPETAWRFPVGRSNVPPGGFLVVFCDANGFEGLCELHASFPIANDGSEPITLWGPEPGPGLPRPIVDQVFLPPLRSDVAFGRFPDGAGPTPVPLERTLELMRFYPPGSSTFGSCVVAGNMPACPNGQNRICLGLPNGEGGNLPPRIDRVGHSNNRPPAGEAVDLLARVEDEKEPVPGNLALVQIRYAVDGVEQLPVDMTFDAAAGVLTGADLVPPRPLERWTIWRGTIPGQAAGARVEFELYVEDAEGLSGADPPRERCPPGVGPCNRIGLPGPDCVREAGELLFTACDHRHQYLTGYVPRAELERLLINEVLATQNSVLRDITDDDFDDFIELCNVSEAAVDLSGLWLSDRLFQPQAWQFPEGSVIGPGEHLIVWTDNDGGKCPRPPALAGDEQECPDPTDASRKEFHTNFALGRDRDQVYLHDRAENGFGIISGVEFALQEPNVCLSLTPDCTPGGSYRSEPGCSPRAPNPGPSLFVRGDTDGSCAVVLTDPVFTLNYLFLLGPAPPCPDAADANDSGRIDLADVMFTLNFLFLNGPDPPPPGPNAPGPDPTADRLPECSGSPCN